MHERLAPFRAGIFVAFGRGVSQREIYRTLTEHPKLKSLGYRAFYGWLRRCPEYKPRGRTKTAVPAVSVVPVFLWRIRRESAAAGSGVDGGDALGGDPVISWAGLSGGDRSGYLWILTAEAPHLVAYCRLQDKHEGGLGCWSRTGRDLGEP